MRRVTLAKANVRCARYASSVCSKAQAGCGQVDAFQAGFGKSRIERLGTLAEATAHVEYVDRGAARGNPCRKASVQVCMRFAEERRRAAGAVLVYQSRYVIGPDAAGMLVDIDASVVVRQLKIGIQLEYPIAAVCSIEILKRGFTLGIVIACQSVSARIFHPLQVALEPREVAVQCQILEDVGDMGHGVPRCVRPRARLILRAQPCIESGSPPVLGRQQETLAR